MSTATIIRKTALDRRMDKIRALEESGKLATKLTNRTLRKVLSNKLAVLGAILFVVIFGAYGAGYIPVDPMYAEF